MKKSVLLVLAIFSTSIAINAQGFSGGVKGGINLATSSYSNANMRVGINAGVLGQFKFPVSDFAFQFEILYSAQGDKGTGEGIIGTFASDYINIPFLLQYYAAPDFYLEFGPHIGFLTSAKLRVSEGGVSESADMKNYCNTLDYGLNFGAAYELPAIPLGFFARYTLGLAKITKDGGNSGNNHRVIQLGAFYKF